MPYRNTKLSISVGVRGTEVLATTQASDVRPGHGTKALIWGLGNDVRGREKSILQAITTTLTKCV